MAKRDPKRGSHTSGSSSNGSNGDNNSDNNSDGSKGEESYEVEEIIDEKTVDGRKYYFLKWKGYADKWNSWEPIEHLECPDVIDRYLEKKEQDAICQAYRKGFDLSTLLSCPDSHNIRVVNKVDNERFPTGLIYTNEYVYGDKVPNPSSVVFPCSCTGEKCDSSCECMEVPYYSEEGLLNTKYQGPIHECNHLCRCSESCPNRVVQRGNPIHLDIFRTESKGWGALTRKCIRKGEFLCRYTGELITFHDSEQRYSNDTTYLFDLDKEVPEGKLPHFTIDARTYGNVTKFFNHSCEPSLGIWAVYINHLDPRLHELAFYALRDIEVGEELTFDYKPSSSAWAGFADEPASPPASGAAKTFRCHCNAPSCRKYIFN